MMRVSERQQHQQQAPERLGDTRATLSQEVWGPTKLQPGKRLYRYVIEAQIGRGSMGVVYRAHDPALDRRVALKLLQGHQHERSEAQGRLLREAQAMAKLNHPNVVTVYEVGRIDDRDFVAMAYVEGPTLAQWLRQNNHLPRRDDCAGPKNAPHRPQGPRQAPRQRRSWREVLAVFLQAGEGLAAAHRAGVVHRDFKPANVLLSPNGRAMVMDFGLARLSLDKETEAAVHPMSDSSLLSKRMTQTGGIVGTPAYMSPEQFVGVPVDARSDQFSYCVALYEALYGTGPFTGAEFWSLREAVLCSRVQEPPRDTNVPAGIHRVLLRGLSVEPGQRYRSMEDLLEALRRAQRRPRQLLLAAAVLGTVLAGLAAILATGGAGAGGVPAGCAEGFEAAWNDSVRGQVRAAFIGTGLPIAVTGYKVVSATLNERKHDWLAVQQQICQQDPAEVPPAVIAQQATCLLDIRRRVQELTRHFAQADSVTVEAAVTAMDESLSLAGRCLHAHEFPQPSPPAPDLAAEVAAIRHDLWRSEFLRLALLPEAAQAQAEAAVTRAHEVDYRPVQAEARFQLGRIQQQRSDVPRARETLQDALLAADASEHGEIIVRALVALIEAEDLDLAIMTVPALIARVVTMLRRYGEHDLLQAQFYLTMSDRLLNYVQKDGPAQIELARRVFAKHNSVQLAKALQLQSLVCAARGDIAGATKYLQQALEIAQQRWGEQHIHLAIFRSSVEATYGFAGGRDRARELAEQTDRFWQSERARAYLASVQASELQGQRRIRGRVVDAQGRPVRDAEVVLGLRLMAGSQRVVSGSPVGRIQSGVQRTRVAADGTFEFDNASELRLFVVAESAYGRSFPSVVAPGQTSAELVLDLRPFGKARIEILSATPYTDPQAVAFLPTMSENYDFLYTLANPNSDIELPAGRYSAVLARLQNGRVARSLLGNVDIEPGKEFKLAVELAQGPVDLEVIVRNRLQVPISRSTLMLIPGSPQIKNLADLVRVEFEFLAGLRWIDTQPLIDISFATAAGAKRSPKHRFRGLSPGTFTLCVKPHLDGDTAIQYYQIWMSRNDVTVDCMSVTVTPTPQTQVVTMEVVD